MIFGGIETEQLQLNENTLYSDEPGRRDVQLDIMKEFDEVVRMLRQRQYKEASDLITARWVGRAQPCYQPLGDLRLYFENRGEVIRVHARTRPRDGDLRGALNRAA